jgi:hypothetical protein
LSIFFLFFFENETELLQVKQKQKPRFYFCCWGVVVSNNVGSWQNDKKEKEKEFGFFFSYFFSCSLWQKTNVSLNQKVIQQRVRCQEKG